MKEDGAGKPTGVMRREFLGTVAAGLTAVAAPAIAQELKLNDAAKKRRVAVGGFVVASSTFVGAPIRSENLQAFGGDAVLGVGIAGTPLEAFMSTNATAGFLTIAREYNWELVPLFYAVAIGGKLTKEAYETARSKILSPLVGAGKLDAVFLDLHGDAAAEHLDDVEGVCLPEIKSGRTDDAILPGAAWQ